jgi:hypothetical protein
MSAGNGEEQIIQEMEENKTAVASTVSTAFNALLDIYKEIPAKVSDYRSGAPLLEKVESFFFDPERWEGSTKLSKEEAEKAFKKFNNTFSTPASAKSGSYLKHSRIKALESIFEKTGKFPTLSELEKIGQYNDDQLTSYTRDLESTRMQVSGGKKK